MKYVVASLSALFILISVFFLLGLLLSFILPASLFAVELQIGSLSANIPSMLSLIVAAILASLTFKASLHAKTGKLYKKSDVLCKNSSEGQGQ